MTPEREDAKYVFQLHFGLINNKNSKLIQGSNFLRKQIKNHALHINN